jgi:beta-galactosidase
MKNFYSTTIFSLLIALLLPASSFAQHKGRISFNKDWKFKLDSTRSYSDPAIDDAAWRTLNLPHDWSIEGSFDKNNPAGTGGGALPGGVGWYRKTFTIPQAEKEKQVFVQFDGVYRNSEVFVNGHSVGMRPYGYSSFVYDITSHLKYAPETNVIVVKVDNSKQPNSRWYSGSGIYRNVWLTVLNRVHVPHWGTYISTPVVTEKFAGIVIETKASNDYQVTKGFTIINSLYDASGKFIARATGIANQVGSSTAGYKMDFTLYNPKLWSLEHPYLYKMVSEISFNGKVVDSYETRFGIRSFAFDREKGFFLNGKPVKILGVCNHHDLGALGAAINTRALERQLEILKAMGCNGIRTSHNPPAPELLDLADRMGFIVMDEAFDMWAKAKNPYDYHLDWKDWHAIDLGQFIMRDRNHPSVFIWSVGNEILEQWGDEKKGDTSGRPIARELVSLVKQLDTTRPVVTANNEVNQWNQIIQSNAFELIGYNYQHRRWGNFLKDWPGKKLIVTESTSALETRGHYDLVPADTIRRWPQRWDAPLENGNPDLTVSAYDHVSAPWGSTHEESILALKKWDHVSGMYIWTGFDYLGEPTPYPWPARSSYFGIIDLAGFPKDIYYLYQSEFTDKPVLHILPHWNWKQGDTVDVVAYYNNADEVELFLNGKSLGRRSKTEDKLHVIWRVPFAPGVLKAVSKKDGKTVLTAEQKTAGSAYKIILKADRATINSDGRDLSFITVQVLDKNGVLVPNADNLIKFSLSGPGFIAGVDNGNPVSMESFKSNQHSAMNGKAVCIVQSNGAKGKIILTANADGLQSSTITINAR